MMDLAEELDSLDQLQALITAYPKIKLSEFSFSRKKVISRAIPYALSVLINQKFSISPRFKSRMEISNFRSIGNFSASKWDASSDVVSMSGVGLELGQKVLYTEYNYTICRASRHIEDQLQILEKENEIWGYPGELPDKNLVERELADYALADAIIVPSEICKDSFRGKGIDLNKVKVVHFPFIQKKLQYTSINKKSKFVITFVGSVTLRKGLPYLLEAIAIAKDFELQVNIVGHYDKKFLEHLSKLRLLDERLIFHGALPRDRVVALLSISDIFVMPSVEEGWPIAWLEAMSMGCVPIVSDAICKLSEAPILDRRMFFQSGNSTDLAEKIFYFYNNPEALQMSKIEVRSTMNNSETWHDFAIQVLEIAKSHKDT